MHRLVSPVFPDALEATSKCDELVEVKVCVLVDFEPERVFIVQHFSVEFRSLLVVFNEFRLPDVFEVVVVCLVEFAFEFKPLFFSANLVISVIKWNPVA